MIYPVENRLFWVLVSLLMFLELVQNQDPDEFCRGFLSAKDNWKPSEPLIRGLETLIVAEKEVTGDVTFDHMPYLIDAEKMEQICDPMLMDAETATNVEGGCSSSGNPTTCSKKGAVNSTRPKRQIGKEMPSKEPLISFLDDLFGHCDIDNVFILVHTSDYQGL